MLFSSISFLYMVGIISSEKVCPHAGAFVKIETSVYFRVFLVVRIKVHLLQNQTVSRSYRDICPGHVKSPVHVLWRGVTARNADDQPHHLSDLVDHEALAF